MTTLRPWFAPTLVLAALVAGLAPAAALFADPGQIAASIQAYNRVLRDETRAAERLYVDLWPLLRRQARAGAWADDHLHPSAAALDEWAAELARALRGRLP